VEKDNSMQKLIEGIRHISGKISENYNSLRKRENIFNAENIIS
jgi:hypothetical protein